MRPWPDRLNRITFSSPVSMHFLASRMAAAMAWQDSGAGMMPSVRANWVPASKDSNWGDVYGFHQSIFQQLRYNHACAVVAEAAGMDVSRTEVVAECEHGQQRGVAGFVAVVVSEDAACQFGARVRFGGDEAGMSFAGEIVAHKWETDSAKIRAAAEAGDYDVGIFAGLRHLFLGLQADDGLMEGYMAENGAEGVFAVGSGASQFNGFGNGCAE